MTTTLKSTQKVTAVLAYSHADGTPAPAPKAIPLFSTTDGSVATVELVDGNVVVTAVGPGSITLSGSVLSDDGVTISFKDEYFAVYSEQAVSGSVTFGAPEDKPVVDGPAVDPTAADTAGTDPTV